MARKYGHIQNYEKEIKEMPEEGMTQREIGEALGFSREQVHGFVKRIHAKERKTAAGEALKKKGRPAKSDKRTESDKVRACSHKPKCPDFEADFSHKACTVMYALCTHYPLRGKRCAKRSRIFNEVMRKIRKKTRCLKANAQARHGCRASKAFAPRRALSVNVNTL